MKEKISAVYQIKNKLTGERYIGSSNDVEGRWRSHRHISQWKAHPNSRLYQDMQKYGVENFDFMLLAPVSPENLTTVEQELIEILEPSYNQKRAKGVDVVSRKAYQESYRHNEKNIIRRKAYEHTEAYKNTRKKYRQTEKFKNYHRADTKRYGSRKCLYNGEVLTLNALSLRFRKAGLEHPTLEATKYLIKEGA